LDAAEQRAAGGSGSPGADEDGFLATLARHGIDPPRRRRVTQLQVNIGLRCNLACHHCHVESGPKRDEAMGPREIGRVLELLDANPGIEVLDITGGAPELHPHFRELVGGARKRGRRVIDRCNLTVLLLQGQEDTAGFLAENGVEIVASLPCYSAAKVEAQRGRGVFDPSIEALRRLNRLGYGRPQSALRLDLVFNPTGPVLPPDPDELEARYREELQRAFDIEFHRLITITNMPIRRFAHALERDGQLDDYWGLLRGSFNPDTTDGLMCRTTLSVDHRGNLHDCDFNLALGIPVAGPRRSIFDVDDLGVLEDNPVTTGRHCLGCTAGAGSSCGGALVEASHASSKSGEPEARGTGERGAA
jgi:radical SAM/Cys-rich protein